MVWPNNGISIAENAATCVRIAATFALTQETSDRTDATCEQMPATVEEIFVSSERTDTKELREQNCVPIEETSGATVVIFATTVATWDLIVAIVARMCATSIVIGVAHVTTKASSPRSRTGNPCLSY